MCDAAMSESSIRECETEARVVVVSAVTRVRIRLRLRMRRRGRARFAGCTVDEASCVLRVLSDEKVSESLCGCVAEKPEK